MMLSLVIPCWGVASFLPDLFVSLRAQTSRQFEVIFVDDGSQDGSLSLLEKEVQAQQQRHDQGDPACYRLLRQENMGVSGARNNGLHSAQGDYILCVDSDDWLEADAVKQILLTLEIHPDCSLLFFDFYTVNEQGEYLENFSLNLPAYEGTKPCPELFLTHVGPWNKVYKRSWLNSKPLHYPEGIGFEDLGFYLHALSYEPQWAYCPKALYAYRQRSGSAMHSKISPRHKEIHTLLLRAQNYYCQEPLYSRYSLCLEAVLAYHGYLAASTRLLLSGAERRTLLQYKSFKDRNCPHYRHNPYLSRKQKLLGFLYDHACYWFVRLLLFRRRKL